MITIVLNGQDYLEQTIQSVVCQSYDNVEYIVIDGGSKDGTLDVLHKYDHMIDYWVSEPDSGIGDAFNKGVTVSTGEWINFMNCGDTFTSPDVVHYVAGSADETVDIVFGKANLVDTKGTILLTTGAVFDQKKFYRGRMLPHQSVFHNRRYFEQYGLFDNSLRTVMCYEMLLRKRPLQSVFIDRPLSNMLVGGVHESCDYLRLRETRMVKREYCAEAGALRIEMDYWHAMVRALIKRALNRVGLKSITTKVRQLENRH